MTVDETVTWRTLLGEASQRLRLADFASPDVDARRLIERASGADEREFALVLGQPATRRGVAHLDTMMSRRMAGEPLQYVIGSWSFRQLELLVDHRVLIPRPETEFVVECALAELDRWSRPGMRLRAVDLGTGSGAIALSIAQERAEVEIWATDESVAALDVARANLAGLGRAATRVRLLSGSWFEALPASLEGQLDLIVSNPPYVASGETLPAEVADWEPSEALRAGPEGTEALVWILDGAPRWLAAGASVVLELAPHQENRIVAAARARGFIDVAVMPDLTGRSRALVGRLPPEYQAVN